MIYWKDIWKEEPPRIKEILFRTGNDRCHHGCIFSQEKLRKCEFHCFIDMKYYSCDKETPIDDRVTHWCSLPEEPENEEGKNSIELKCSCGKPATNTLMGLDSFVSFCNECSCEGK